MLCSVSNNTKGHIAASAVASKQERPSKRERPSKQERESVKLCRQLSAYSKHHIEHQHQACNHFQPMAHRYRVLHALLIYAGMGILKSVKRTGIIEDWHLAIQLWISHAFERARQALHAHSSPSTIHQPFSPQQAAALQSSTVPTTMQRVGSAPQVRAACVNECFH